MQRQENEELHLINWVLKSLTGNVIIGLFVLMHISVTLLNVDNKCSSLGLGFW